MRRAFGILGIVCALLLLAACTPSAQAADKELQVLQYQDLVHNDFIGRVSYYYDQTGKCVREVWNNQNGVVDTVEYTYGEDAVPQTKRVYRKDVLIEETQYDKMGNQKESRAYSENGSLKSTTKYSNTYDDTGRMTASVRETEMDGVLHGVQTNWNYEDGAPKRYNKGDVLTFGNYEQDGDSANGPEPIQWKVLDTKENHVLVISVHGLDSRSFHNKNKAAIWETSDLRAWLNGEFLNSAFTAEEQSRIPQTYVEECPDQIFLLSLDEVRQYFTSDTQRRCVATDYAVSQDAAVDAKTGYSGWLLRTPGKNSASVIHVSGDGSLDYQGCKVRDSSHVVRPVMWIDTSCETESVLRYYGTTEYTIDQGLRAIQKKERYTYDALGHLEQYYVETSNSYTRWYDYTNTCQDGRLIYSECVCTEYGQEEKNVQNIYYAYDSCGRQIRELRTYLGGDGYTEYTWEYDDQGNLLKYSDQYRAYETNYYSPLSQAMWEP